MEQHTLEERKSENSSRAEFNSDDIPNLDLNNVELMPSSLSQIDFSVLQQLPEEIRADVLGQIPAHRQVYSNSASVASENQIESTGIKIDEKLIPSINGVGNNSLWAGDPPLWVHKFKASNFSILKILAEMYYKSGSTGILSQVLQQTVSTSLNPQNVCSESWDEAIHELSELLKQYITLMIEVDLEEIYLCFRILRRYFWLSKYERHSISFTLLICCFIHFLFEGFLHFKFQIHYILNC